MPGVKRGLTGSHRRVLPLIRSFFNRLLSQQGISGVISVEIRLRILQIITRWQVMIRLPFQRKATFHLSQRASSTVHRERVHSNHHVLAGLTALIKARHHLARQVHAEGVGLRMHDALVGLASSS